MKTSVSWPLSAKVINGLCWAGPFAMISVFQSMYPVLGPVGDWGREYLHLPPTTEV